MMKTSKWKKKVIVIISIVILIAGECIYHSYFDNHVERFLVTLDHCVDGDTAWFIWDGEKVKSRFLYIDTPESTYQQEYLGKEASLYSQQQLENATTIEVEFNADGDHYDKYERALWWIFVDGELLQEKIARDGYVKKFYDYGYDYKYKEQIIKANEEAKANHVGLYQ